MQNAVSLLCYTRYRGRNCKSSKTATITHDLSDASLAE